MLKKDLTDGIEAVLTENGALFILLVISISPQPFMIAALAALSLAALGFALWALSKTFTRKHLLLLSVALSGTVFGLASRLVTYPLSDLIFIVFSVSAAYLIFILSRKFSGVIAPLSISGALAAFIPAAFTIAALNFMVNSSAPGGLLITAATIILYRILWRHIS